MIPLVNNPPGAVNDSIKIKSYHIERLNKCKLADLDRLHKIVYRKPHPADYFAKKYNTAYTGAEYLGYVAYNENNEPIAYYGVVPCFIRYHNQLVLAAQSVDNMTHPKYRFKGLLVQLANLTYDLCAEEGISLIFGFPNQNSLHSYLVKLKWQMTESVDCYVIDAGILPAEKWLKKIPYVKNVYKQYQQRVLKKYLLPRKGIENSVFKDGFAGINRNALYLNYKTYHETYVIKLGRAVLWIKLRNNLIIGDMDCRSEDFDDVMHQLKKLAIMLGMKEIHFHTCHQTRLSTMFSERYEMVPSYYLVFKDLGCHIPLDKIKFTFADVDLF
ncbi:MAG TPA: GNAT family N-acetyltransferase [Mucilaginibacter sp.]|nr:GNAT family N-acetyltransferase [Mucilaginibacter sp.]